MVTSMPSNKYGEIIVYFGGPCVTCLEIRGLLYKSSMDCLLKTVHNEGFWALYKGFLPCWMRMGPWSLTFWLTYEQIRSKCGTSAF
ncbi:hypothetical protein HAZT_HAZT006354 [Hyalella azteca]|uniref:Uncharacterized protein n=1 Tax=Hyalella azteca TaxID=294128 RepID=A0A6A0H1I3_HYAAZ|nr:hypothetical protein HAZT_HAZT006354 [Hyalella azteca]